MFGRISVFINSLTKTKKNLLLGGFLIGALALTVIVAQGPTSYKQRASEIVSPPTTTGNISLAAQATKTTLIPGEQTDLDVYLLAGDQNVTGLSFSLAPVGNLGIGSSAPAIVSMLNVILPTPPVFNNTLRNSAAFSFHYAGVDTVGNVASGKVKIATIKIAAVQRGNTELIFQNVQATALGQIGLLNNQQNVNIQFTVGSQTTPTVSVPTATPTPGIIGSCKTLYDKIIAAYDNANACGGKYDAAADLNKDKFVNNQDYLLFLQNTNSGTNQVACTNYLSNTTNPCAIPTPTTTITIAPPTATPSGPVPGDATGDKVVDIRDYNRWRDEYLGTLTTKTADFNKDGRIDLIDFSIFRNAFSPTTSSKPIACEIYGDMNRDGKITLEDKQNILQSVADNTSDPVIKAIGDVSGDQSLSVLDAQLLDRYIQGIDTTVPVCKDIKPSPCNGFGDITGDGKVTLMDVVDALRLDARLNSVYTNKPFTDEQKRRANVDGNNSISTLMLFVKGTINTFPACATSSSTR